MIQNVEEIIDAISLEDIIREHVPDLKRTGANYKGLSPFTEEKTPSFVYSPKKGMYKCFSSGQFGFDACKFLRQVNPRLTFTEAMEQLSARAGISINYGNSSREELIHRNKEDKEIKESLLATFREAHKIYLSAHKPLKSYAGKKYEDETVSKWGIINRNNDPLLINSKLNRNQLKDLGLVGEAGNGDYDFFYNRILYPIHDKLGNIVSYSARAKSNDQKAKYLNTKNSPIYNKSKILFGYHLAAESIRKKEFSYLVEGATDVIKMHESGIENVLAPCGTAFTDYQAREMSRMTDIVVIIPDGDAAGSKSVLSKVQILIEHQMQIMVLPMPYGWDPADFLQKKGSKEFMDYSDDKKEDAIAFVLKQAKGTGSEFEKMSATKLAADLLVKIKDQILRSQYIKKCSAIIGNKIQLLQDAVKDKLDEELNNRGGLTPEQEQQKINYGVYVDKNKYFNYKGNMISNFIFNPLFLVRSKEYSQRVFEIVNHYGHSSFINLKIEELIKLPSLKAVVEGLGTYVFWGKEDEYIRIREMLYVDMEKVFLIETLGFQPHSGIFAWSNGITLPDGAWHPIDENGVVSFNDKSYFLPTFSRIEDLEIREVNDLQDDEFEVHFRYIEDVPRQVPTTLAGWSNAFYEVFGDNSMICIAYYLSSVFRDWIFKKFDFFPILNLFGPPGSGKTYLARNLTGMFGIPLRPTHSVTGSDSSFFRKAAQARNNIAWYEEYSEKVSELRQEGFKNFYDGFGRTLSSMTKSHKTRATQVSSAILLSGQVLPAHDPALLERCITVFMDKIKATSKQKKMAERLSGWSKSGFFSNITAEVHGLRQYITDNFEEELNQWSHMLENMFQDEDQKPDTRIVLNYSIPLTVFSLISKKIEMPFTKWQMCDGIYERIKDQLKAVEGINEVTHFWESVEYLLSTQPNPLLTDHHFQVVHMKEVNLKMEKEKLSLEFPEGKDLIFIWFNFAYMEFEKASRNNKSRRILSKESMKKYLEKSSAYMGENRRRLGSKQQRCMVFDPEELKQFSFGLAESDTLAREIPSGGFHPPSEGMEFQDPDQTEIEFS